MVKYKVHRVRFVPFVPQAIHCLAVEGKNKPRIAVSRADSSIEIWNIQDDWYLERKIPGCKDTSVEALVWSGSRLFSSGLHGEISEWDLNKLLVKRSTDSYGGAVWSLAINHDQSLMAAGCEDGCVRLFDITSNGLEYARVFSNQEGRILSICWHKDGQILVAGGSDGTIRVYGVATGHARLRITMDNFSQRNTLVWALAITSDLTIISGDSLGNTQFWDGKHGTLIKSFNIHIADVLALCINKDEDTVYSSGVDNKLMQFKLIKDKDGNSSWTRSSYTRSHTHDIRALALIEGKKGEKSNGLLISGGVDTNILVYSEKKFDQAKARKIPAFPMNPDIHLSSKAQILMYQKPTALHFWKLGKTVDEESLHLVENPSHLLQIDAKGSNHVVCSAVSDDGAWTAFSDVSHLSLFRLSLVNSDSSQPVQRVKALPENILPAQKMKFTSDSSKLITVTNEKSLQIINLTVQPISAETVSFPVDITDTEQRGPDIDLYSPVNTLAVSADGTMCACSDTSCCINVFDIQDAKHRCSLPRFENQTTAMAFQPETNILTLASTKKEIVMFDIEKMKMTEWSKQTAEAGLPRQWRMLPTKVIQILFDPISPNILLLQSHDMFTVVDTAKPVPEKHVKLFEVTRNDSNALARTPRKRKHGDANEKTGNEKEETPQPDSFKVCRKYQPLLFMGQNEDNSLVTVERSWLSIMDSLPPTLHRKRYGT